MPVEHYENFPVASLLVPAKLRRPIEVIYHFARSADDIADEGDALPAERLAARGRSGARRLNFLPGPSEKGSDPVGAVAPNGPGG